MRNAMANMANMGAGTNDARTPTTGYPVATRTTLNALDWIAMAVLVIGGLNWGLVGLFGFDLVAAIFGTMTTASRIVYVIVGLAALYAVYLCTQVQRRR